MDSVSARQTQRVQVRVNEYVRSVYNWMAMGLLLTGVVAYFVANNSTVFGLFFQTVGNQIKPTLLFWGCLIGELVLVFSISARVQKMSASTATGLFMLYAGLNGATLSIILLAYTSTSIASTFFICAGTFTACSIYGWVTKRDLTSMGGFLFMGLIGIIIASIVNMFLQSSAMHMVISYIGVFLFIGLTAYDTQKIKHMAMTQPDDVGGAAVRKGAILGALSLYLDFINMFLFMLRIFGGRE